MNKKQQKQLITEIMDEDAKDGLYEDEVEELRKKFANIMDMLKKYGKLILIKLLFIFDYFIFSKPENRIDTCIFWVTIVIFQIWREMIEKRDK
jgi:hypothetical protein